MDDLSRQHCYEVLIRQQNQRQRSATANQVDIESTTNQSSSSVRPIISQTTMEIRALGRRIRWLREVLLGDDLDIDDLMRPAMMSSSSNGSLKRKEVDFEKGLKEISIIDGGDVCGICLDETKVEDEVKVMECSHLFHSKCISEWIKRKTNCPTCRHEMSVVNPSPLKRRRLSRS